jgi:N-acetylneuraminate synthase
MTADRGDAVYIIAEAGVNHNGSAKLAHSLVDVAAAAGADAVKFQSFRADDLVSRSAPRAAYQAQNLGGSETQHEMLRRLELSFDEQRDVAAHAKKAGIDFLSTPFDLASLEFLARDLELSRIKLGSGDLTNAPLVLAAARTGRDVILSSGMASLEETLAALGVLAFGYTAPDAEAPTPAAFARSWASEKGRGAVAKRVTLLHCTSEYPTPPTDVNLRAMDSLREATGLRVGLSDHSEGIAIAIAAAARGAAMIEKHFTLDRSMTGPDHRASIEPRELELLVTSVRDVEHALGSGVKAPVAGEMSTRAVARRSLVARAPIRAGEVFSTENLSVKRPGTGVAPTLYWDYLGRVATRDYACDELIDP